MLTVASFLFLLITTSILVDSKASLRSETCRKSDPHVSGRVGVVADLHSRFGKELKIALEMGVDDFRNCSNLVLHFGHSHGRNPASSATEIISRHGQVDAIIGSMALQEAALVSELKEVAKSIPILSISPRPSTPLRMEGQKFATFIEMNDNFAYQTQCIVAIVGHFRWRKVVSIYEQGQRFSADSGLITHLSDSLQAIGSRVEHHLSFPCVSSLSNPRFFVEKELKNLRSKNVKVLVITHASFAFAVILFEKAKSLGMMEKGYVWIVSDEIANLLDSAKSSTILHMQGVIGFKTGYVDTSEHFREFKSRFRRKYIAEYSTDEENSTPSLYALRAYDAISIIVKALRKLSENTHDSGLLMDHIRSSDFEGSSGKISFKNGLLASLPEFQVVNVIGKSYKELGTCSPKPDRERMTLSGSLVEELSSINWPGGERKILEGHKMKRMLKIGVPAQGAFPQFVTVTYDSVRNKTNFSGFSITIFRTAAQKLQLNYTFVAIPGLYEQLVTAVQNKTVDAAVGDTAITAQRYLKAEFSQPYIQSSVVMLVTVRPEVRWSEFIGLNAFTVKMWILLASTTISASGIIWLSEYAEGNEHFTVNSYQELFVSVLWFSVTILSHSQREEIRSRAGKLVLATWTCIVFIVGATFTAVLSSIMTVPRLQNPSILDVDYLIRTNATVGCNLNSFIGEYLTTVLPFKAGNIRKMNTIHDYPEAFARGDIKAAFLMEPHAKVFLAVYCKGYTISGQSYKLGGLGFVFPKGSTLSVTMSEAVLDLVQNGDVDRLEKQMLTSTNCTASMTKSKNDLQLGVEPFSGLFKVLGGIMAMAFLNAVARLARTHGDCAFNFVQTALVMKRVFLWASLVLAGSYARFKSSLFAKKNYIDQHPQNTSMSIACM